MRLEGGVKMSSHLTVVARSPFKVYYEGPAQALSATNSVGDFDILPGHADFFSMLTPCAVTITPEIGEPITFPISKGIVTVRDNEVLLFVNM